MRAPNVFTISPALPFLETFVAALFDGAIVPGAVSPDDPLRLADATIYVPTRRAARALAEAILRHTGGRTAVLPKILPLGALEATESELILAELDPAAAGLPLPPAASSIWRRLHLAALIQRWAEAVGGALRRVDVSGTAIVDEGEAFRVATSTVDAFALAGNLAALIDELQIEGIAWRAFDELRMAGFDDYWRITTTFLAIAIDQWPGVLRENGLVDPAARQIALVDAQAQRLASGDAQGPVIAIGSTGTNRATARLLAAIARSPRGGVVLPGLDLAMDEVAWSIVSGRLEAGQEPSFGHPQAAMARLLPILGIERGDVRALGSPEPVFADRVRFVAEALRPADTTEMWRAYSRKVPQRSLAAALDGVSLIEATDEREEALCLAIAMREVLETPGRTAALVTPDRELARRVRGELARWSIEVHDTGGEPLALRPLGLLARHVAAAAASRGAAREALALLAHPLASFGMARETVARLGALLEIGVLRVVAAGGKPVERLFDEARRAVQERPHDAQRRITEDDWAAMAVLWRKLVAALEPLCALDGRHDLACWVEAHRRAMAATADAGSLEEADALEALFAELEQAGDTGLAFDAEGYGLLFGRLAGEVTLGTTSEPHPHLTIYGLLEARLMPADVMLLGGLDETIWPPQARSDAFLNRPMRHDLGLTPPERRIGQTAHDFTQAMGHRTVILSRARKRGGSPCVPSRFLLRLSALGDKAWRAARDRGRRFIEMAEALDGSPREAVPATRPQPRPAVELRPHTLSVTQIETLRRDPYAIYASKILGLAPLPQLGAEIDASEFGTIMHGVLHRYVADRSGQGRSGTTPVEERRRLRAFAAEAFAEAMSDPVFETFRWPAILKTIDFFLRFDGRQRLSAREIKVEETGRLSIPLADGSPFTLIARADRIDWLDDGSAVLVDYKTGQPPGLQEVLVGFAPQLTLEAAMLREGGFGTPHQGAVRATYLKLGGKDGGSEREVKFDTEPFEQVVDRHFAGLHRLLSSFRAPQVGYPSRPFPKYARTYGDFDHLARVREWSLAADDETAP